jgi:hypothetical protein
MRTGQPAQIALALRSALEVGRREEQMGILAAARGSPLPTVVPGLRRHRGRPVGPTPFSRGFGFRFFFEQRRPKD